MDDRIVPYDPPSWASHLNFVPTSVAKLTMSPTPIHKWKLPGTPDDFSVYIKRDDMTGGVLTGNKVRKMDFLLAEAIKNSCKHIITGGVACSNHVRTAAPACVQLGLQPHLFIKCDASDESDLKFEGNLLISRLVGADMHLIPKDTSVVELQRRMDNLAAEIEGNTGEKSMTIPIGGSNVIGIWGYIDCFDEILKQDLEFDDLVCVNGSVGTVAGLAIANHLCGSPYKLHSIRIGTSFDTEQIVKEMMKSLGIPEVSVDDLISVYEDYAGLGYGQSQPDELEYINQTAAKTGILLEPTYTGKAAYGLSQLMQNRPEVFKGRRVLFLHSGGSVALHCSSVSSALLPHSTKSKIVSNPPL